MFHFSYCKDNAEIRDQPFGIQVRNVRCIKCHKWGHINTDKECPLFNQSVGMGFGMSGKASGSSKDAGEGGNNTPLDAVTLVQQMREDGLALKRSAIGLQQHMEFPQSQQQLISSDEDDKMKDSDMKFLKSLSTAQKKKLLKKLEKLEKKTKSKSKKKSKKKRKQYTSDSDSVKERTKKHRRRSDCSKKSKHNKDKKSKESKKSKYSETSSSSSSSSSESSDSSDDIKPNKVTTKGNGHHYSSHDLGKSRCDKNGSNINPVLANDLRRAGISPTREGRIKSEKQHSAVQVKKEKDLEGDQEDKKRYKDKNRYNKDIETDTLKRKHESWKVGNDHKERKKKRHS